jgi:hypothetical protein
MIEMCLGELEVRRASLIRGGGWWVCNHTTVFARCTTQEEAKRVKDALSDLAASIELDEVAK